MKTLSIRQPWAELIIQGRKTLELRTWTVAYRGPLLIHASQTVERDLCLAHGLDPDQVTAGALVGTVDLAGIDELDERSYAERSREHLAKGFWDGDRPLYGWRLANPKRLPVPVPMRGRMGLFESALPGDARPPAPTRPSGTDRSTQPAQPRLAGVRSPTARTFELRVQPSKPTGPGEPAYRLALYQADVQGPAEQKGLYEAEPAALRRVAELGGSALRAVAEYVMEALRANGYRPTDLSAGRREPFALAEESGVRLGLLFLAVRPITRVERIDVIAQGIRAMTSEEAYYWYSKCTGGPVAERAQKALRVLLAAE